MLCFKSIIKEIPLDLAPEYYTMYWVILTRLPHGLEMETFQ